MRNKCYKIVSFDLLFSFLFFFSVVFTEGVNVDWSGWCFDDDEVMDHLQPEAEGLLEGISRSLAFLDPYEPQEQENGECSQV